MRRDDLKLLVLAILAVGMTCWAVIEVYRAGRPAPPAEMTYLIQGLDVEKIATITVRSGKDTMRLEKRDDAFVLPDKSGYPASTRKVNNLILSVNTIQVRRIVSTSPDSHETLGVHKDAETLVEFLDGNGKLLGGFAAGKDAPGDQGRYVRPLGSDAVYTSRDVPYIHARVGDFADDKLLELPRERIESVTVERPDDTYALRFPKEGDTPALEPLPAGKKLVEWRANSLVKQFDGLKFEDVFTREQADKITGLQPAGNVVCRLRDMTVYRLSFLKKEPPPAETQPSEGQDKPPAEPEYYLNITATFRAEEFARLHAGWTYRISRWDAEDLLQAPDKLLEDAPAPATQPTTEPASPPTTEPANQAATAPTQE